MSSSAPRRRSLIAALAVTAIVAVGALAGCSSPDSSEGSASDDATVTLALNNTPASIDPASLSQSPDSILWSAVYDRLITITPEGEYAPSAAESWEFNEDNTQLTLTLRDDLSFADGSAIDSSTVKATLDYVIATPGQAQSVTSFISGVDAPDATTVVINLSSPDPMLINSLATTLGVIGNPDDLGSDENASTPLASGPYEIDEDKTVVGSSYVLERREDYWNADAFPYASFTVKAFADRQAMVNALQSGEIDLSYVGADQVGPFENDGYTITEVVGLGTTDIIIADRNGEMVPALGDVRVRQAINMAFDREKIVEQIQGGAGEPAFQEVYTTVPGFSEDLVDAYPYDPERARELMAEAGYADGFDVTIPSTFLSTQIDATVVQALADIGIRATLEVVQPQDLGSVWASPKYAMGYWVAGGSIAARSLLPHVSETGYFNPWKVTDPEVEELIARTGLATTDEEIEAAWQAVNTWAVENAVSAPISYVGSLVVAREGVDYLGTVPPPITTIGLYAPTE
ncbi:ABC transporter substrate-binding protein [Microbacterium sp. NPDC089318]